MRGHLRAGTGQRRMAQTVRGGRTFRHLCNAWRGIHQGVPPSRPPPTRILVKTPDLTPSPRVPHACAAESVVETITIPAPGGPATGAPTGGKTTPTPTPAAASLAATSGAGASAWALPVTYGLTNLSSVVTIVFANKMVLARMVGGAHRSVVRPCPGRCLGRSTVVTPPAPTPPACTAAALPCRAACACVSFARGVPAGSPLATWPRVQPRWPRPSLGAGRHTRPVTPSTLALPPRRRASPSPCASPGCTPSSRRRACWAWRPVACSL